jgi:hypothetical protein
MAANKKYRMTIFTLFTMPKGILIPAEISHF